MEYSKKIILNDFKLNGNFQFQHSLGNEVIKIFIGRDLIDELDSFLKEKNAQKIIIITDNNVKQLYGDNLYNLLQKSYPTNLISFSPGELSKNLLTLNYLLEKSSEIGVTKNTIILSVGGGVVNNISGMVAGLLFRGLKLIHIPTTIMAQIDASISRKQAVNGANGKNLFGLWKAPEAIFINFDYLKTLDERQIKTGFAESIKLALLADIEFFEKLEKLTLKDIIHNQTIYEEILLRSIDITCKILGRDPYEGTSGLALEVGHTIGHAIEILSKGKYTHGEAISIGMVIESQLSALEGIIGEEWPARIKNVLRKFQLPTELPKEINFTDVFHALKYDNKRMNDKPTYIQMNNFGNLDFALEQNEGLIKLENLKQIV